MWIIPIFRSTGWLKKKFMNLVGFLYQLIIISLSTRVRAIYRKEMVLLISVSTVNCSLSWYELKIFSVSLILPEGKAKMISSKYLWSEAKFY